ncbi:hypothetical protein Tco_0649800 [Tanacetum coccineum]
MASYFKYRQGEVDEPCPVCRKVCLDSFGEHAVHCKELPGFKYRHDLVRDVLYDVLKRAEISSKKEAPVNFLTDPLEGRSTLRPADILVFGWAGGKHACVDLTGVSPLVGLRDNGFVAGQAALKAESSKVAKHDKACLENQHVFIPFAFDTFGFLAPEADEFLTRVQRVVQSSFILSPSGCAFFSVNVAAEPSSPLSTGLDCMPSLLEGTLPSSSVLMSHVAATAAGNYGVPVVVNGFYYGRASGMAPRARLNDDDVIVVPHEDAQSLLLVIPMIPSLLFQCLKILRKKIF